MAEVLVLIEHSDGNLKKVSLEALSAAREVGEPSAVVVAAEGTTKALQDALKDGGAEKIYSAEGNSATEYLVTPKVDVLSTLVESNSPAAVIVPASIEGKEIAARVAARLGFGLLSDVIEVKPDTSVVNSIFGGSYTVYAKSTSGVPIITIRPGAIEVKSTAGAGEVIPVELAEPTEGDTRIVSQSKNVQGDRPGLTEASIVVSGGRGVGSEEKFHEVIEPLADALGAAVGASRAAVDSGFYPGQFQVGQTGSVVSPQLYIALGISGAIQHRAGMQTSKTIISVNTDPEAPIFDITDFGVIGDLFAVAPQLTEAVKKHKG